MLWGGAICVGSIAILFALGAEYANVYLHRMLAFSPYLPLVVTPDGLALAVYVTQRVFPGAEGSGIPQVIAALQIQDEKLRGAVLSLKIAAGKIVVTLFSLLVGAAIGREGPTVQIGASIMHSIGKFVRFSRHETEKGLILAGGAVWIVLIEFGLARFGSFNIVGAIAALLGGIVLFGSNSSTWKQTDAALAAAQARRSELIDALEMRTVDDADAEAHSGAIQSRSRIAD